MQSLFFEDLLAIMATSLVVTVLVQRLRAPNIIAYLLAGCLVGPHLMGWVAEPSGFTFLAEFGVVFLLFSLGLEFSLPKLMSLRGSVFGLGGIQVGFCSLAFGIAVWFWGSSTEAAIIIAGALALSSTAVVTKELSALRRVHTRSGQLSIGVLLFQDLAAIVFLIIVPVLGSSDANTLWISLLWAGGKGVFLVILFLSLGKWLLPLLYKEIAQAQSEEIFVLSTLVLVMLAAWITHSFHLSMALGGFVIGMMLGESPFRHQINTDIRPFKDILLGLFFVTIGMSIQIDLLLEFWPRLLLFTIALIAIKALLISFLVRILGDPKGTALDTGLALAQAGEFGLALLALGEMNNIIPHDQASFIMLIAIFSMAASPFLIRHSHKIVQMLMPLMNFKPVVKRTESAQPLPAQQHVIIGGFGRVGKTIARLLEGNGIEYIAIEKDVSVVNAEQPQNQNLIYGDCTKLELLRSCHIADARLAILTFRSIDMAKNTIEQIRTSGIEIPIIVRCCEHGDFAELISLGADYVIPEMLEASLSISVQVLTMLGITETDIERQIELERSDQLRHLH